MQQTGEPATEQFTPADIKRYRANLKDEVDGAALYRLLSEAEGDPHLKELFLRLSETEIRHQDLWRRKLTEAGAEIPAFKPSLRIRALGWVARRFGTQAVTPLVARMEAGATTMYDSQPEAIAENLPSDERSHARVLRELRTLPADGRAVSPGQVIVEREGRHRGTTSGNALRAAVLGANDGLVSNLSLVMGVAGASPGRSVVLLGGIAGLLAGAISMALGEWISVRSSTEAFAKQARIEREELEEDPLEEMEELVLIYRAKGLSEPEARETARRIFGDKERALVTLLREELDMSPDSGQSAWVAAITSFLTFSVGAVLPVAPWLFVGGALAVGLSALASAIGLFIAGGIITLFTGRSIIFSGGRMLVFGLVAAVVTFGIGRVVGVSAGV